MIRKEFRFKTKLNDPVLIIGLSYYSFISLVEKLSKNEFVD